MAFGYSAISKKCAGTAIPYTTQRFSVFPLVQANMHTLRTTARFESERKPWATSNVKYILDPE